MRYRTDRGFITFHLFLFLIAAIVTLALIMRTTTDEQVEYSAIKKEMVESPSTKSYTAEQKRSNICREILLTSKGTRLKTRLTAGRGVLSLCQDSKEVGFTEHLEDICCVMQEELYYDKDQPMQKIRLIQAHEADYNYSTNMLTTQEMTFARFVIPSHDLVNSELLLTPTLTGKAHAATITFKETGPEFHAQHLQVTLPHARVQ